MGIRKKILVGFVSLGFLLFFSGMVSLVELNRLGRSTQNLLETSASNMEQAKKMLDAVQEQNTALLQMAILETTEYDSLYIAGRNNFDKALAEATVTVRDRSELDSVYVARERYNAVIDHHFSDAATQDHVSWFINTYKTSYYDLTAAIKNYMINTQYTLGNEAARLENNAHRATVPSVIALGVAILVIVMFFYFIDLYFVHPVTGLTQALQNYLDLKVPFKVSMEGKDEVFKLKELIEKLIMLAGKKID